MPQQLASFVAQFRGVANWTTRLFVLVGVLFLIVRLYQEAITIGWTVFAANLFGLAVAFVSIIGALLFGSLGWLLCAWSAGIQIDWRASLRVHLASNPSKYLPGYAWQLLSKRNLLARLSTPDNLIGRAFVLEFSSILFSGALVILWVTTPALAAIVLLLCAILLWLVSTRVHFHVLRWCCASALMGVGWILHGVAFWVLCASITALPVYELPRFIADLTGGILVGLMAVGVPAGIGIRELVVLSLLAPSPVLPIALVLSLLRVLVLVAELGGYFLSSYL